MFIISKSDGISGIMKDYICLGFIVELDDLFALSFLSQETLNEMREVKISYERKEGYRMIKNKLLSRTIFEFLSKLYYSVVFYAIPYYTVLNLLYNN
jgi:hypothetical protein